MTKLNIIENIKAFLQYEQASIRQKMHDIVKYLQSPDIDLIVWNDIDVPITENAAYLFSDGETTTFVSQFIVKNEPNQMIHWLNRFSNKPIIKWAKAPQYKSK